MGIEIQTAVYLETPANPMAKFLEGHEGITAVYYPGLESFPQHELAKRQMDDFGGMVTFEVVGGYDGATRLLNRVNLCALAVSLGNIDTLTEHRVAVGITDGMIRIGSG